MGESVRDMLARRAAQEIKDGMIVNLGIGIPSLVPNYLSPDVHVMFHAENGVLGMGPTPQLGEEDANLCNAAGYPVTVTEGASYCDSSIAFGMIRRGLIDITILGALQVSEKGDLANWIVPNKRVPGIGGAMDLAQKSKKVIVVMNHVDKYGNPKVLKECSLPLTSQACVDMIITEMAVMAVRDEGLVVEEIMPPYTLDDVLRCTDATVHITPHLQESEKE
nr:3-oxoacid CoA-transferase subunit B [Priestia taiwanensis]